MSADPEFATATEASEALVELIKPMFAGMPPEIVGATLAQLLAILIAGHNPEMRDEIFGLFIEAARDLIPVEIEIMIDAGMIGPEWREVTKQ